ncbi:lamin tail domain-containing protein [Candidatus Dojkabacteria bacterium]|nr:lamin tail domain-containing protein [Candidatus Dojkabacteria bacterium]
MPNPEGSDTDYEWIEIYNEFEETIDLFGCEVDSIPFPKDIFIDGESYMVVTKDLLDKDNDGCSFEERWGDGSGQWGDNVNEDFQVIELAIGMKNTEDSAELTCGDYEDSFFWEEAPSGQSFSIDVDRNWRNDYKVTPGQENEEKPEEVYIHSVILSEVYSSPQSDTSDNEWLELYNCGDQNVNLIDWIISDNSGKQTLEGVFVNGGSYLVLESENLSLSLNNSGETLTLYDPNEEEVDIFIYSETTKGLSNMREWDGTCYLTEILQTQKPTKGKLNEYVDPHDLFYGSELLSVLQARRKDLEETVCIEGIVTVELGKLGSKISYVQDESGGVQLYLSEEEFWADSIVGDKLKVIGEVKEVKGESRLYIDNNHAIKKVSSDNSVKPGHYKTGDVGEKTEGILVFTTGEIVETSGSTFYVDDGSGKIKILVKSSTGIETPSKKKGQYAGIVGIVSQYGEDSYRVLPRYASDIVISNDPVSYGDVLAVTGQEMFLSRVVGVLLLCGSIVVFIRLMMSSLFYAMGYSAKELYSLADKVK